MAGNLTAMIAAAFAGGVVSDPYFEYTTLLLPGNGTNGAQNNTFLDASTNNFTITRNGNTTQGTFSPFSQTGWGNYFNGTNAYLNLGNQTALHLGTSSYTVEMWLYKLANTQYMVTCGDLVTGATTSQWQILADATGTKIAWGTNVFVLTSSATIPLNTWTHIAFVRNAATNTLSLYINGSLDSSVSNTDNYNASTSFYVGQTPELNASRYWNGYISNFRMVKGVAVYTGNFTPPTSALTATQSAGTNISAITGTQTSLLTCQSNRFVDNSVANSGTGFAITVNGSPSVQAFSPFNPTSSWSAATNGGSGYFDGNTDSLTAPNSCATLGAPSGNTNDFTIEGFYFPTNTAVTWAMGTVYSATNAWGFNLNRNSSGVNEVGCVQFALTDSFNLFTSAGKLIVNQWNHVAAVRTGTTVSLYVNGIREATNTSSVDPAPTGVLQIGRDSVLGRDYLGYVSNVRIVRGATQPYNATSTTITVPTAPLTNITNTSLLLNFTNAGIYDATSKNDLETADGAQISTAITAKWGSGCMKFDGTGDYLKAPTSNLVVLRGDWTLECWVYLNTVAAAQIFFDTRAVGTDAGYAFYITGSSKLALYTNNTSVLVSTNSISASVWTHVAMSRQSNTIRAFINGNLDPTTASYSAVLNCIGSILVGSEASGSSQLSGYMQDLRITNGVARYTTSFPAPTAAFPTL